MFEDTVHIIGNGLSAGNYNQNSLGVKLTCNVCPVSVPDSYAACIVDFRMMQALTYNQGFDVAGEWVLGMRPKIWMEKEPAFYMKNAWRIKEFYTHLPKYVANHTDFSCGHMATHYGITKFNPKQIHMWGFDSIFDFELKSFSDTLIPAERSMMNTGKLTKTWRAIWPGMFNEFSNVEFIIHHIHNDIKIQIPKNVSIFVDKK